MELEKKYVPLVRLFAVREKLLPYGKETIDQPEKVAKLARCMLRLPLRWIYTLMLRKKKHV